MADHSRCDLSRGQHKKCNDLYAHFDTWNVILLFEHIKNEECVWHDQNVEDWQRRQQDSVPERSVDMVFDPTVYVETKDDESKSGQGEQDNCQEK